jgi:hypothetical protein
VGEKRLSTVNEKKEQNVLERIYEPKRLLEAWRQVKLNAGAAGVDMELVFLQDYSPSLSS